MIIENHIKNKIIVNNGFQKTSTSPISCMPKRDQVMIPTKGMTYEPRKKINFVRNYNVQ